METMMIQEEIKQEKFDEYISQSMSYEEYRRLIDALIMVDRSTAKKESSSLLEYSKLNVVRMNRLDKTTEVIPELENVLKEISAPQDWLVLTEGWCGDAAQIVPVLHKMAVLNPLVRLRFLLRDEHLELMDEHLTRGARSIPKLVVTNSQGEELFSWGPRPAPLQELFYHMKANAVPDAAIKEEIHRWYAKDKTLTTQNELMDLLKKV